METFGDIRFSLLCGRTSSAFDMCDRESALVTVLLFSLTNDVSYAYITLPPQKD